MMILGMNLMVITEEKLRHRPTTQRERNQPAGDRRTNRTEVMEENIISCTNCENNGAVHDGGSCE